MQECPNELKGSFYKLAKECGIKARPIVRGKVYCYQCVKGTKVYDAYILCSPWSCSIHLEPRYSLRDALIDLAYVAFSSLLALKEGKVPMVPRELSTSIELVKHVLTRALWKSS